MMQMAVERKSQAITRLLLLLLLLASNGAKPIAFASLPKRFSNDVVHKGQSFLSRNNVALGKRSLNSLLLQDVEMNNSLTDGDTSFKSCLTTRGLGEQDYLGVDFQRQSRVMSVRLYIPPVVSSTSHYARRVDIIVGPELRSSDVTYDLASFQLCRGNILQPLVGSIVSLFCHQPVTGRIILLVPHGSWRQALTNDFPYDPLKRIQRARELKRTRSATSRLALCELEVFMLLNELPERARRSVNLDDQQSSANLEETHQKLVQNVQSRFQQIEILRNNLLANVTDISVVKYAGSVVSTKEQAIPILWDDRTKFVTAIAFEHGLGRGLALSPSVLQMIYKNYRGGKFLRANIDSWLNRGSSSDRLLYHSCESSGTPYVSRLRGYKLVLVMKPTCLVFDPERLYQAFMHGDIPNIIINHSGWNLLPQEQRRGPFFVLAEMLGVRFTLQVANWHDSHYHIRQMLKSQLGHLPLPDALKYALISEENFGKLEMIPDFSRCTHELMALLENAEIRHLISLVLMKYQSLVERLAPTIDRPLDFTEGKNRDQPVNYRQIVLNYNYLIFSQSLVDSGWKLPGVSQFPGDLPPQARKDGRLFKITVKHQRTQKEHHGLGLYLRPGETLSYKLTELSPQLELANRNSSLTNWFIIVGCHIDRLVDKLSWTRFPIMSHRVDLKKQGTVFSPVGGLLYIGNDQDLGSVMLELAGVEEAIYFHAQDETNHDKWRKGHYHENLVPWAEITGSMISFCVPAAFIRQASLANLTWLTKDTWDRVVLSDMQFIGENWRTHLRQRAVFDIQLRLGYGHSGYPIVANVEWLPDLLQVQGDFNSFGTWGMCHEIGHNFQHDSWTPKVFEETTNNVMALMNYKYIFNQTEDVIQAASGLRSKREKVLSYLRSLNAKEHRLAAKQPPVMAPYVSLQYFEQLVRHFGYGLIQHVWQQYRQLEWTPAGLDSWILMLSHTVGMNFCPLHRFWGFDFDWEICDQLDTRLPCFQPNDWITDAVSRERYRRIFTPCSRRRSKNKNLPQSYPREPNITVDLESQFVFENDVFFHN